MLCGRGTIGGLEQRSAGGQLSVLLFVTSFPLMHGSNRPLEKIVCFRKHTVPVFANLFVALRMSRPLRCVLAG